MRVIPVTPAYAQLQVASRPGGVTAIGVISIILASLALIANLSSGVFGLVSIGTTKVQQLSASRDDLERYPLVDPGSTEPPGAMSDAEARAVAHGLNLAKPLTPVRQEQVIQLARRHGKTILPFAQSGVSAIAVRNNVSSATLQRAVSGEPENVYVMGEGTLTVNDTRALFRADNGNSYRSTDPEVNRSVDNDTIDRLLSSLTSFAVTPNADQKARIITLLRDEKQLLVTPETGQIILGAGPLKEGGLWFSTPEAQVRLDRAGTALLLSSAAPEPGTSILTGRKLTTRWANLLMIESLFSGLLAVLLLVGAIFLLRGRPVGRKLCTTWAMIKLPMVVLGAILLGLTINEWLAALTSDDTTPPSASIAPVVVASLNGLVGLIWALIVLVVLTRQPVRDYFKNVV